MNWSITFGVKTTPAVEITDELENQLFSYNFYFYFTRFQIRETTAVAQNHLIFLNRLKKTILLDGFRSQKRFWLKLWTLSLTHSPSASNKLTRFSKLGPP
jgi:hypothetical protein